MQNLPNALVLFEDATDDKNNNNNRRDSHRDGEHHDFKRVNFATIINVTSI